MALHIDHARTLVLGGVSSMAVDVSSLCYQREAILRMIGSFQLPQRVPVNAASA
jgi:hypothetical protein